ncbi:MAG TPA: sialidase family protein [Candidatus Thermoplasmatota archaeon]|nr:sialidase family protein [Candidatus Thermoplasmatota archaeon]
MAWRLPSVLLLVSALALPTFVAHSAADAGTTFTLAAPGLPGTHGGVIADAGASPGRALSTSVVVDAPVFTSTVSQGAEPSILVDRLGRGILVGDHLGVSRSTDGGATWTDVTPLFIPGHDPVTGTGIYDGWVVTQDPVSNRIYTSTTDGAVINVASSDDGGATWNLGPSEFVVDVGPIADRPWLAAKGGNTVAMIWNVGGSFEGCSASNDGGTTFTQRSTQTNLRPIGGQPAWDSLGRLAFIGGGTLYRYNGGPCSNAVGSVDLPAHGKQISRQVASDSTGHLYTAIPSANNQQMQLLGFTGTTLAGSKTLVVSGATLKGNTFGTIASRPGEIAVSWYGTTTTGDFNNVNFNGNWNVYVARVKDFWGASPQIRVDQITATPNHVGNFCFGGTSCDTGGSGDRDLLDYYQITYDTAGDLHLAYGHDGATANAEVRYAFLPVWT